MRKVPPNDGSSEFMRTLRARVEPDLAFFRKYHGDESPAVRLALTILQIAADVEAEIAEERVPTSVAMQLTGWSVDTLQRHARAKLEGNAVAGPWSALDVVETTEGYVFRLSSIPPKGKRE
jgi:hypothetical protein